MLNSTSSRFPNGFGNDSGELGCNIMDHNKPGGSNASVEGYLDVAYTGRRPNGFYIPRYRNVGKDKRDYLRGFGYQGRASRSELRPLQRQRAIGEELKKAVLEPGPWNMSMTAFGEILPYHENHATLDRNKKDKHGLPLLVVNAVVRENERKMEEDMRNDAAEMLEAAGYKNVKVRSDNYNVGNSIHESGTARMGNGPEEVGAQQVQPGSRLQERVRHRRFVHAFVRLPEPVAHLHGFHGARRRPRRQRTQEGQPMNVDDRLEMQSARNPAARRMDVGWRGVRARGARDPAGMLGEGARRSAPPRSSRSSSPAPSQMDMVTEIAEIIIPEDRYQRRKRCRCAGFHRFGAGRRLSEGCAGSIHRGAHGVRRRGGSDWQSVSRSGAARSGPRS